MDETREEKAQDLHNAEPYPESGIVTDLHSDGSVDAEPILRASSGAKDRQAHPVHADPLTPWPGGDIAIERGVTVPLYRRGDRLYYGPPLADPS